MKIRLAVFAKAGENVTVDNTCEIEFDKDDFDNEMVIKHVGNQVDKINYPFIEMVIDRFYNSVRSDESDIGESGVSRDTKLDINDSPISPMISGAGETIKETLHKLWSAAVGSDGYDKNDWLKLEAYIDNMPAILRVEREQDKKTVW